MADAARDSEGERRAWLEARRRALALQLEALSPRASRHHVERIVALRRRQRALDAHLRSTRSSTA